MFEYTLKSIYREAARALPFSRSLLSEGKADCDDGCGNKLYVTSTCRFDDSGVATVTFTPPCGKADYFATLSGQVTCADDQRLDVDDTPVLVRRARRHVVLSSSTRLLAPSARWQVAVTIADDDVPVAGSVDLTLRRSANFIDDYRQADSSSTTTETIRTWTLTLPPEGRTIDLDLPTGGVFELVGSVTDAAGRQGSGRAHVIRQGPGPMPVPKYLFAVLDAPAYLPGQTAKLLVLSPTPTGIGYWTKESSRITASDFFAIDNHVAELAIPLDAGDAPLCRINVHTVNHRSSGSSGATAGVGFLARLLGVSVTPSTTTPGPGEEITLTVSTTNAAGAPVQADVTIAVHDASLQPFRHGGQEHPYDKFYGSRSFGLNGFGFEVDGPTDFRKKYLDAKNPSGYACFCAITTKLLATSNLVDIVPGLGRRSAGSTYHLPASGVRREFRKTAYWTPRLRTNAQGRGTVTFTMPDDLRMWRVLAIAIDDVCLVGQTETTIETRQNLAINLDGPAFVRPGETLNLSARLTNTTAHPMDGELLLDVPGAEPPHLRYPLAIPASGAVVHTFSLSIPSEATEDYLEARCAFFSPTNRLGIERSVRLRHGQFEISTVALAHVDGHCQMVLPPPPDAFPLPLQLRIRAMEAPLASMVRDLVWPFSDARRLHELPNEACLLRQRILGPALSALAGRPAIPAPAPTTLAGDVAAVEQANHVGGGWRRSSHDPVSSYYTAEVLCQIHSFPAPHRQALTAALDLDASLRWLRAKYESTPIATSSPTEDTWLVLARAFEALSRWRVDVPAPQPPPDHPVLLDARYWADVGMGYKASGDTNRARAAAARLEALSSGDAVFRTWCPKLKDDMFSRDEVRCDEFDVDTRVLALLAALAPADTPHPHIEPGLRWLTSRLDVSDGSSSHLWNLVPMVTEMAPSDRAHYADTHQTLRVHADSPGTALSQISTIATNAETLFTGTDDTPISTHVSLVTTGPFPLLARIETTWRTDRRPASSPGFSITSQLRADSPTHPTTRTIEFDLPRPVPNVRLSIPGPDIPLTRFFELDKSASISEGTMVEERDAGGRWKPAQWCDSLPRVDDARPFEYRSGCFSLNIEYLDSGHYRVVFTYPPTTGRTFWPPARLYLADFPETSAWSEGHWTGTGSK